MRISDWSSDVCSSDLKLVTPGDALRYPLFKATPRWTIEGFGCHLLRPIIVAGKPLLDIMVVGIALAITDVLLQLGRSEERRVGNECGSTCRSGSSPYPSKKKKRIKKQKKQKTN